MTDLKKYQRTVLLVGGATILAVVLSILGSRALGASNECNYQIKQGDWLSRIAQNFGTDVSTLVDINGIENPDLIFAGDTILVCERGNRSLGPVLVPRYAEAWGAAVTSNAPDWATDDQTRFLIAVAHFESAWCEHLWNPRDAGSENGTQYAGSYGCVQIRVEATPTSPHRDLERLRGDYDAQAAAAWHIFGERLGWGINPYTAWGPARNTRGGPKLAPSCDEARNPAECNRAWQIADAVR